ncbi:MFS transporter, partial [Klebsiella pneumoniae]
MESQNITIDPQTDFKEGKAEPLSVPLENTLQRSSRIKKIQTTAMILLFLAAVINYLDRSSLSVANLTIRQELGLNATEIGALLSVFSLAYGIAQLPCGPLLDRKGPRIMLGLGMFFWSLFQALSGMVHSFTQFVLVRIGMGIGEAPMNPCGVKVINDWFNIKERGRPMGFFNAASTIGVAVSPPILAAM